MDKRQLPALRGLPMREAGHHSSQPAHLLDLPVGTPPTLPGRPPPGPLAGPDEPRGPLFLTLAVPDLATYRALKGRAFLIATSDVPYDVTLHIVVDDQPIPVSVRMAMARMGVANPELLNLREIDIVTGYDPCP